MKAGIVFAGNRHCRLLPVLLALLPAGVSAAEVRGSVSLQQSGLFSGHSAVEPVIGLALWPAEPGLTPAAPTPVRHRLRVDGSRIRPDYLLVRPGEEVRLVNLDPVEHQLFALVPGAQSEVDVRLRPGRGSDVSSISFTTPGTRHLFCRLHRRSYARIDVVDAPHLRRIGPGEQFEFRNLEAGRWRLRVAGIGAETLEQETVAVTAPPPLQLRLPVRSGMQPTQGAAVEMVTIDQLFPARPER